LILFVPNVRTLIERYDIPPLPLKQIVDSQLVRLHGERRRFKQMRAILAFVLVDGYRADTRSGRADPYA